MNVEQRSPQLPRGGFEFIERWPMRAVVIHRGEDGYWVAECPSLPGCVSQGKTRADAISNIKEAIDGWLETAKAHGTPIADEDFDTQVICV